MTTRFFYLYYSIYGSVKIGIMVWVRLLTLVIFAWRLVYGLGWCLRIHMNLISMGRLDDEGFYSLYGGTKWKLSRGSLIVARGEKSSCLYCTQAKDSKMLIMRWKMIMPWSYGIRDLVTLLRKECLCCLRMK